MFQRAALVVLALATASLHAQEPKDEEAVDIIVGVVAYARAVVGEKPSMFAPRFFSFDAPSRPLRLSESP